MPTQSGRTRPQDNDLVYASPLQTSLPGRFRLNTGYVRSAAGVQATRARSSGEAILLRITKLLRLQYEFRCLVVIFHGTVTCGAGGYPITTQRPGQPFRSSRLTWHNHGHSRPTATNRDDRYLIGEPRRITRFIVHNSLYQRTALAPGGGRRSNGRKSGGYGWRGFLLP
jgi:hypothetical protein